MFRSSKLFMVFLLVAVPGVLNASPIFFSGSSGNLAASAAFDLSGSTLIITLANTSTQDVLVPADVLTGLLFNSSFAFKPVSASLDGPPVFYKSTDSPGDGWGYGYNISAHGMNSALSASGAVKGLGQSNFSSSATNLGGLDYGILSAGDMPNTGNAGVLKKGPLFKDSLQFTLAVPEDFKITDIGSSVVFQYGTSLSEPWFSGNPPKTPPVQQTPEPGTMLLLSTGGVALAIIKRRSLMRFLHKK
jgi:hypothetical protein